MRNYFTFGDYDSRDFGVFITRDGVYNAPRRVYRQIQVPGRNGDLMLDEGRFENIDVTYPCLIYKCFDANVEGLRNALLSHNGYVRIMDSYHPDEYRLGCFSKDLSVMPKVLGDGGTFEVTFNCKPQRFLTGGEVAHKYTEDASINNPTLFASKPLIRVTFDTEAADEVFFYVGSDKITLQNRFTHIDINSDIQDCYSDYSNANPYVQFQNNDFPVLEPGVTGITIGAGIESIEVTPRWYIV